MIRLPVCFQTTATAVSKIESQTFFKIFPQVVDKTFEKEYNIWVKGKGVFELQALSVFVSFFVNN